MSEEELQQQNEKQRYTEHQLKRRIERLRQSPIRNRREDTLEAQWREEARKEQSNDDARVTIKVDDTNNSSYSIADVLNFATSLIEPSFDGPSPKLFKEASYSSVASGAAEKTGVRGFKAVWFSSNRYRSIFRISDLFEISGLSFVGNLR